MSWLDFEGEDIEVVWTLVILCEVDDGSESYPCRPEVKSLMIWRLKYQCAPPVSHHYCTVAGVSHIIFRNDPMEQEKGVVTNPLSAHELARGVFLSSTGVRSRLRGRDNALTSGAMGGVCTCFLGLALVGALDLIQQTFRTTDHSTLRLAFQWARDIDNEPENEKVLTHTRAGFVTSVLPCVGKIGAHMCNPDRGTA